MKRALCVTLLAAVVGFGLDCKSRENQSAPQALQGIVSAADRERIVSEVTAAMSSYSAAIKALDTEGVIAHYAKESEFRLFKDGILLDYDTLTSGDRVLLGQLKSIEGDWLGITVVILGPDVAAAVAPFREVFVDQAGLRTPVKGAVTWIWVRRTTGWKMLYGHATHEPDTGS